MRAFMNARGVALRRFKPALMGLLTYAATGMVMPDYPLPLGWRSMT